MEIVIGRVPVFSGLLQFADGGTAVFNPEKEKSHPARPFIGIGKVNAFGLPKAARFSKLGPPG